MEICWPGVQKNNVFIHATSELYIFVLILENDFLKLYQGMLEYFI